MSKTTYHSFIAAQSGCSGRRWGVQMTPMLVRRFCCLVMLGTTSLRIALQASWIVSSAAFAELIGCVYEPRGMLQFFDDAVLLAEDFRSYFENFGTITDVVVMYDHQTQRPRGFGFISFDQESSVETVMEKSFHELNGKTVRSILLSFLITIAKCLS